MLECTLNKHHTGLTLWGDYMSLRHLHELVHTVVEGSVVIEDKEGFMLGLAYDVRDGFVTENVDWARGQIEPAGAAAIPGRRPR